MSIDLTETIAPKSDQLNADDLMAGPRTFTIAAVSRGDGEQPVNIELVEFGKGRPFKPCKSMRRVLVVAWGADASAYVGRRMTLYRDSKVRFGGQDVGGIRISHMSDIDKRLTLALTVTRGKRAPYVVEPLPDDAPPISAKQANEIAERITAAADTETLGGIGSELRGLNLGEHREQLVDLWKSRRAEVNAQ